MGVGLAVAVGRGGVRVGSTALVAGLAGVDQEVGFAKGDGEPGSGDGVCTGSVVQVDTTNNNSTKMSDVNCLASVLL